MSEQDERLAVFQGPRGPQGNQGKQGNQGNPGGEGNPGNPGGQGLRGEQGERGERGASGLSRPVRRALVYLFVLSVGLALANLLWTAHVVQAGNQSRCGAVVADATIPLPPQGDPARAWAAAFEAIARQRATQLGCK